MSRLPRRKRRRGKGPNRQPGNGQEQEAALAAGHASDEHGRKPDTIGGERIAGQSRRAAGEPGGGSRRSGRKRPPGSAGKDRQPGQQQPHANAHAGSARGGSHRGNVLGERPRTRDGAFPDTGSGPSGADRTRKRGRRKARPDAGANGDAAIRGMRAPVQRAPDAQFNGGSAKGAGKGANAPMGAHSAERHSAPSGPQQRQAPTMQGRPRHWRGAMAASRGGEQSGEMTFRRNAFAALDLGTNNCRLLVAVPQERGRFRVIDGFSRIVRLGEGLGRSGRLSEAAMDRALEALAICAGKLGSHVLDGQRLIATEACRQAENGAEFLARVQGETGLELEVIDRRTEAFLAAEGCGALMDREAEAAVLFDIGGGSSELILVDRRHRSRRIGDQIVAWTSVPVGVVTLAERHGGMEVGEAQFRAMVDEVRGYLEAFEERHKLAPVWSDGRAHLLGTSGTVTTLAGIHLELERYDRRRVDGLWMQAGEIDAVVGQLLQMSYAERAASPCVGKERADLVMAGCAILEAIREMWPSERLRVADRGLREGILTQLMEHSSAWRPKKRGRWRNSRREQR